MKTIVVSNRKGGVGKTTVATHLAAGLATMGLRTALVDTDPQGHSASAFGLPKANGLHTVMTDLAARFADHLYEVPVDRYCPWPVESNLFLLPSDKRTSRITEDQPSPFRFRRVLRDMADLLDLEYVVVDTGPSNSMFDGSVMLAADHYIIVTQCAALSFDGVREAMSELEAANRDVSEYRNDEINLLGIVPNMMRANTNNHRDNIGLLGNQFPGLVWKPVALRTVWEAAFEYGHLVYSYAPYEVEFHQAWDIVDTTLKTLGEIATTSTLIQDTIAEMKALEHAHPQT